MKQSCLSLSSLLLSASLLTALALPAHAAETPATPSCTLKSTGDCCEVTVDAGHDATVQTSIVTASMTDFLMIRNTSKDECDFLFNGEMQVPMHAHPDGFNGTWVGGNSALHYLSGKGSCHLALYYMNIANNLAGLPTSCVGGKTQTK